MSDERTIDDLTALTQETRSIWNQIAEWWDEQTGEGNEFQRLLIGPTTERLLDLQPGECVLDVACGNGKFSRRMAQLGARVVACDFSEQLLKRAREKTVEHTDRIVYKLIDVTNENQLLTLGTRRFDAAVCTMGLMDITTIEPLLTALSQLLKIGGRFVFSVTHPCFNSSSCKKVIEEEYKDGEPITTYSVKVSQYIRPSIRKYVGIVGQPIPHYTFDRPISVLFNACFHAGFILDGLEEPVFDQDVQAERSLSSLNFKEIPPGLFARMRLLQ